MKSQALCNIHIFLLVLTAIGALIIGSENDWIKLLLGIPVALVWSFTVLAIILEIEDKKSRREEELKRIHSQG